MKHLALYGACGGILIVAMRFVEYRFLVVSHSIEMYAALIAEGLSNKEMAERLFVSENTVKTHASRVFDKLGASRRTQAVQMAKSQRILT